MNLQGSITELQNAAVQLYLKLEHRFRENGLIRELWGAMAHDVSQQANSLKALPHSFWSQIKKDGDGLIEATIKGAQQQITEKTEDLSLPGCLEFALHFEEPAILKIYVPIIRCLRKNPTYPALDFYIMVKAHLARILRVTESFSGDPLVIQRSNLLLQSFEKDVQEPEVIPEKKAVVSRLVRGRKQGKRQEKVIKHVHTLAKRVTIHHDRSKPLVKKVSLHNRRARR